MAQGLGLEGRVQSRKTWPRGRGAEGRVHSRAEFIVGRLGPGVGGQRAGVIGRFTAKVTVWVDS